MAITINKRPHKIASSGNTNSWIVTSDIPSLVYLMVTLKEATTNGIVAKKKVYKKPNSSAIEFDVSDIIKNLSESVLFNNVDIVSSSFLPAYKIEIEEWFINYDVLTTAPKYIDSEVHYFFEGNINEFDYLSFHYYKYNLKQGAKALFLTNNEPIKEVVIGQKEVLKIFNTDLISSKLKISYFTVDGDILKDVVISIPNGTVNTFNVSPSVILNHPIISGTEEEDFVSIYKVEVLDVNDVAISESRIYKIVNQDCNLKPTHIIYKNPLGGWDSVKFLNRVETISVIKNTMNGYMGSTRFTSDGKYSNGKLHINTTTVTSYTATSELLSDVQSKLIKELLYSNKVYVVYGQYLIEISIDTNKYKVLQRHINSGKKSRFEISFTSPISLESLDGMVTTNDIWLNYEYETFNVLSWNSHFVTDKNGNVITLK